MKKIILVITVAVVAVCGFTGCEKEEIEGNGFKSISCSTLDIELIENPYTIEQHLNSLEDQQEATFDRKLLQIATCLRDFFKTSELNAYVIGQASLHANDCVELRNFGQWEVVSKSSFSASKIDTIVDILGKIDLSHRSNIPQHTDIEHYIPAIFVLNSETADQRETPIIGTGVMANEELPDMQGCEDCMIVWYYDSNTDQFVEGLMNEEMSQQTTHPIFIIDNANEMLTNRIKEVSENSQMLIKNQGTTSEERFYLASNEFRINYRYETSGKSEFCITGIIVTEDGTSANISRSADYYKDYHLVSKVPKQKIGENLSNLVDFVKPYTVAIPDLSPMQHNYVYWNSFERDFARSKKPLGTPIVFNNPYYLYGKMKYATDWYAFDPDSIQNHRLDLVSIFNNQSLLEANNKGSLRIWRQDR